MNQFRVVSPFTPQGDQPQAIDTLKSQGYTFAPLTNEVQPIVFPYERLDQCKK